MTFLYMDVKRINFSRTHRSNRYTSRALTVFGHRHLWKLLLQLDDEHSEAVGDAAADDCDDEDGEADEPASQVLAHDPRYLDVLILRLLPRVLPSLRRPGAHHAHRLRYEAHHDEQRAPVSLLV